MKSNNMKKLSILFIILTLIFMSCEDSISKQEKKAARQKAKQQKELVEIPIEVPEKEIIEDVVEKVVHVTYKTVLTDSSYWYVVMKDDITNWHGTVELATPYFDFFEAKKQFEGSKGKCYFKFIIQINKETIPTFETYND